MTERMENLDLDAIRESEGMAHAHTVRMNGREWKFKARVSPNVLTDYLNMDENTADDEAIRIMDEVITKLLVFEERQAWADVRAGDTEDQDVSVADMERIIEWAMPLVSGRPLSRRSDSSPGGSTGTTGRTSAGGSGSQEETPTGLTVAG